MYAHVPFTQALAMQSCCRNSYPAPDLVLRKPIFPICVLLRRSVFSQTPVPHQIAGHETTAHHVATNNIYIKRDTATTTTTTTTNNNNTDTNDDDSSHANT